MAINIHDVVAFSAAPISNHFARLFITVSAFLALRARRGGSFWPDIQPLTHTLRWRHWRPLPDGSGGSLHFPSNKTRFHLSTPVFYPALPSSTICPLRLASLLRSFAPPHIPTGDDDFMFIQPDGKRLSRKWMLDATRRALNRAGRPLVGHLSSKSWRRGAATSATTSGIPEAATMQLGSWKSSCYVRYVDLAAEEVTRTIHSLLAAPVSRPPLATGKSVIASPSLSSTVAPAMSSPAGITVAAAPARRRSGRKRKRK
jgi:hypothetical protein